MKKATMMNVHTARFAAVCCAASACSENNTMIILLDAILASIFALISILGILSIRLLTLFHFRTGIDSQMASQISACA